MMMPGLPELIVILIIVLIFFGTGKLPEIGKALGKGIKGFKDGSKGADREGEDKDKESDKNLRKDEGSAS